MSRNVCCTTNVSGITEQIDGTSQLCDITGRYGNLIAGRYVVFWADVPETQKKWGKSRHRVIVVGSPEISSFILVCDIVAHGGASNPWLTVRVQVGRSARVPDLSSRNSSNGASKAVTYHYHIVRRVCRCRTFKGIQDARACFEPAVIEPLIRRAAGAEVCGDGGEISVRYKVANGFGASERKYSEGSGVIDGNVASHICGEGAERVCQG